MIALESFGLYLPPMFGTGLVVRLRRFLCPAPDAAALQALVRAEVQALVGAEQVLVRAEVEKVRSEVAHEVGALTAKLADPEFRRQITDGVDIGALHTRVENAISDRASYVIPHWYNRNFWEPTVQLALRDLCRPRDVVFDVGANAGALSMVMSRLIGLDAYLADVITKLVNGHLNSKIDELLPWAYPAAPALRRVA